jgi:hypothetical protein
VLIKIKERCILTEFNDYRIEGEIAIIKLVKRDGREFDCIIDKEDLEKINFIRWHVRYAPDGDNWYATSCKYLGTIDGKARYRNIHIHSIIMDVLGQPNIRVDHKNHDGLDNRKENLRLTNVIDNAKNRKSKNKNNSSGYRNVSWVSNKWTVQLQVNGKNTVLGKFDDVHEAGKFAEEMRNKYYGKFKGAS